MEGKTNALAHQTHAQKMFVNAGVQTNALDKLIRVQKVNANVVKMVNALIHRNVLMDNAKTVSNCPSYDPAYDGIS